MSRRLLALLLGCALFLSACAPASSLAPTPTEPASIPAGAIPAGIDPFASGVSWTRMDGQGAIVVEVTPLNLNAASEQIEFDVALNTHSIDLSMDLAALSTLTTDTGLTAAAELWDAPLGGHHTSGKLVFPSTQNGVSLLGGAIRLRLTIKNLDAPSRVFEWDLD